MVKLIAGLQDRILDNAERTSLRAESWPTWKRNAPEHTMNAHEPEILTLLQAAHDAVVESAQIYPTPSNAHMVAVAHDTVMAQYYHGMWRKWLGTPDQNPGYPLVDLYIRIDRKQGFETMTEFNFSRTTLRYLGLITMSTRP